MGRKQAAWNVKLEFVQTGLPAVLEKVKRPVYFFSLHIFEVFRPDTHTSLSAAASLCQLFIILLTC